LQLIIGGVILYMIAQVFLSPTPVPGLMSAGLIVLVLGSIKIIKEKFRIIELLGSILMGIGILMLNLSRLSIDMSAYNILELDFVIRITIFTLLIFIIIFSIQYISKYYIKGRGVCFPIKSGFSYSLGSIWIGPIITFITIYDALNNFVKL